MPNDTTDHNRTSEEGAEAPSFATTGESNVIKSVAGKWAVLFSIVFAIIGCGSQSQFLKETSAPVPPSWIAASPADSNDLRYFVGIRTGASTLEEGKDSAVKDASGRIAGFLKSRVSSQFEETTTQLEQNLKQQLSARSNAEVRGARVIDWYYEKVSRVDRAFRVDRYDVYVLVSYPKVEVGREMERQAGEKRAIAGKAHGWYRKGMREEETRRYTEARESYLQVINELDALDEVMLLEGGFVDTAGLLRAAKAKAADLTRRSRRLAIRYTVRGNEESYRQFNAGFSGAVVSRKIEVGDDDPAYEVTGEVSIREGGVVMGNYVAYASGSLELRRVADGRIVSVVPLQAKGFHRQRGMAALNALKEGGSQAGESVAKAIFANESKP